MPSLTRIEAGLSNIEKDMAVLVPLAEISVEVWNDGLAFDAKPTQETIDRFGVAVIAYLKHVWDKEASREKEKTQEGGEEGKQIRGVKEAEIETCCEGGRRCPSPDCGGCDGEGRCSCGLP